MRRYSQIMRKDIQERPRDKIIPLNEARLRRPSQEEIKNIIVAALAQAQSNYNLRKKVVNSGQGKHGSLFVKEGQVNYNIVEQKKIQTNIEQPISKEKLIDIKTKVKPKELTNQSITKDEMKKKVAINKVESVTNAPSFDLAHTLSQMKILVPFFQMMIIPK